MNLSRRAFTSLALAACLAPISAARGQSLGSLGSTGEAPPVDPPVEFLTPPEGFRGFTRLPLPSIDAADLTARVAIDALRPPAGEVRWVAPGALAGRAGTADDPSRLAEALQDSSVGTIMLLPGEYYREQQPATAPVRSLNWVAAAPGVQLTGWNTPSAVTWTRVSGAIFQAARSGIAGVYDISNLTSWGDYTRYKQVDSLHALTAPGQWATSGSTVYVWPLAEVDLSTPAGRAQIRLQIAATGIVADGTTQYAEGIELLGCSTGSSRRGLASLNGGIILARDCAVRYHPNGNGVNAIDGDAIFQNVDVSSCGQDGFSYREGTEFIEVDCRAHHVGLPNYGSAGESNNATTAHDSVVGIRVSGTYDDAAGPVVADVNSSQTWNIGCRAGGQHPDATIQDFANISWYASDSAGAAGPAQQWLDTCTSDSAVYGLRTVGQSTIHTHRVATTNASPAYPESRVLEYSR